MSLLTEIAEEILANSKRIDAFRTLNSTLPTSFGDESLTGLPADLESARLELIDSTQMLKRLALGPKGAFMGILYSVSTVHHRYRREI